MRVSAPSSRIDSRLRGALLLPVCVLAVHQLRFYLAYGSRASTHLAASGHAYLSQVEPFALLCVALALGSLLGQLARAWQAEHVESPLLRAWLVCAAALLVLYCGQELVEGAFAHGHAAGLNGIFGQGGWIAVPVALVIGGGLALTLRAAQRLVALVAGRRVRPRRASTAALPRALTRQRARRLAPLAALAGPRAPPPHLSL